MNERMYILSLNPPTPLTMIETRDIGGYGCVKGKVIVTYKSLLTCRLCVNIHISRTETSAIY